MDPKHYRVTGVSQLIQLNVNSPDANQYNGAQKQKDIKNDNLSWQGNKG